MIDPQTFILFLSGALLLNITPGPDMAFTLATATNKGARAGVAAALGIGVGSLVWAILTAAGLAAILAASDHALTIIKLFGGAYLIFLAIQTYRHRRDAPPAKQAESVTAAFRSGVVTNLFNPKVGLFYLAFLPAFTDPAAGALWLQILALGGVFSLSGAGVLILVAMASGGLRERLLTTEKLRERLNIGSAGVFGVLGGYLIFSNHR